MARRHPRAKPAKRGTERTHTQAFAPGGPRGHEPPGPGREQGGQRRLQTEPEGQGTGQRKQASPQAQERAEFLQSDAERKHTEVMGTINQQRTVLEGRLEQLRTFEREYRTRLKTYLESQLEELGQRGSAAPADTGDVGYTQY